MAVEVGETSLLEESQGNDSSQATFGGLLVFNIAEAQDSLSKNDCNLAANNHQKVH